MINKNKIFAFCGRKRSGKGVLANVLKDNYGAEIVTVANYLKHLCCDILECDLETLNLKKDDGTTFSYHPDSRWYEIINKQTGIPISDIEDDISGIEFTNIRQMLQVIGTDCIRKHNPQWHVKCMKEDIKHHLAEGKIVAVDDVRFPNEKAAIEELGGECYFIVRPINKNISNHVSETSLLWSDFDYNHIIINDSDLKIYETQFIKHFKNDMNDLSSEFLLSERREDMPYKYKDFDLNFGLIKTPLVEEIIKQNKDNENFLKYGIISFKTTDRKLYDDFLFLIYGKEFHKTLEYDNLDGHSFIFYNPIVNENLKIYL